MTPRNTNLNIENLSVFNLIVLIAIGFAIVPMLMQKVIIVLGVHSTVWMLALEQGVTLLYWIGVFLFLKNRYPDALTDYLSIETRLSFLEYVWQGLGVFFQIFIFAILYNFIVTLLGGPQSSPYEGLSRNELLVIASFAVVSAPFVEEFIFRGALISAFQHNHSPVKSVIYSGIVFTLFHGWYLKYPAAIGFVFGLSLIFGFARLRNQSVLPGIIAHGINNALAAWIAMNMPLNSLSGKVLEGFALGFTGLN